MLIKSILITFLLPFFVFLCFILVFSYRLTNQIRKSIKNLDIIALVAETFFRQE
jgi:hypothetical protein